MMIMMNASVSVDVWMGSMCDHLNMLTHSQLAHSLTHRLPIMGKKGKPEKPKKKVGKKHDDSDDETTPGALKLVTDSSTKVRE